MNKNNLLLNTKFTSPIVEAFGYRFAANVDFNTLLFNFIYNKAPPSDFKKLFSCKIYSDHVSISTFLALIEKRHSLETLDLLIDFGNFDLAKFPVDFSKSVFVSYSLSLNRRWFVKNELHMTYFFFLARGLHFYFQTILKDSFVKKSLKKYSVIWNWPQYMLLYCFKKSNIFLILF
jgi:hypothetical protein